MSRRAILATGSACALFSMVPSMSSHLAAAPAGQRTLPIMTGAAALAADRFAPLAGKRIGLITNQTGRMGERHLVDVLSAAAGIKLAAIFAPEHGFRGKVEAGEKVASGRDPQTGIPVVSLYGATRKPTPAMLVDIDVLVFDIQDVGVRSYTYISTMGLAMQAASARGIPFVVLDRPNPLGGDYVSGFVLEASLKSFVGQYPIPIVHGMTVGELARMIKGERWLPGLEKLDLTVIAMQGWSRAMRWPDTKLGWVATSPNIPSFASALSYPGIGIVGETLVNEGRGTPEPFTCFGASWIDGEAAAASLNGHGLPGVRFAAVRYTPRAIPNVAAEPRFRDQPIEGVRLLVSDVAAFQPVEAGIHALAYLKGRSRTQGVALLEKTAMFNAIVGTPRLLAALERGAGGEAIIASWAAEVTRFKGQRGRHLLY